jgi:hypothetical protein
MLRKFLSTTRFAAVLTLLFLAGPMYGQGQAGQSTRRLITQAVDENRMVRLAGNTRPEAVAKNDLGLVDGNFPMDMMLQLQLPAEKEQELEQLTHDLEDPHSPSFHKWLTGDQFKQQFSLAPTDIQAITAWLQSHGFTVNVIYARSIDFSGTAAQVGTAFRTEIHDLEVGGERHFANMSDPQIPAALAPAIVGVVSLHNFMPRPLNVQRAQYTIGAGNYAVVPADLATIYSLNSLFAGGKSGQGQTIVLLEDSDVFNIADWSTFRSTLGLSGFSAGSFTQVHPTMGSAGACTDPGATGDDGEATIDVEWASAGAPSAAVELASCANTTNFGAFIAMQNLISASGTPPAIMSLSYGSSEVSNGAAGNAYVSSLYQQAVTEGVSIFVSTGDEGAALNDRGGATATHGINVNGDATTAYNVAVGGTDFGDTFAGTNSTYWSPTNSASFGSALSYIPEIPWNSSCGSVLLATFVSGSGVTYGTGGFCNSTAANHDGLVQVVGGTGGPSSCATGAASSSGIVSGTCAGTPKPSWQSVFGNPKDGVRDTPDVSLFAANGIWGHFYVVCFSDPATGQGGAPCTGAPSTWSGFGGTSVSAPIVASIQALVNQSTGSKWGNPNPTYYALAANEYGAAGNAACSSTLGNGASATCVFYDVTQGDNDVPCTGGVNCYLPSGTNGVLSTGPVASAVVTAGGSGYTIAPNCAISAPSNQPAYSTYAGGVPATCTATVTAQAVSAINIINGGAGYAGSPICTLSGGGGSGATCTAATGASSSYQPSFGSAAGWDSATGIGTINAANLVSQWPAIYTMTITSGTPQTATVGTAFANPLVVTVTSGGNPASGVTVTFTAPTAGASGTFAGGVNQATTNASGVATSGVFTANGIAGAYAVTASVSGETGTNFALTNAPGPAARVAATSGTPQSAPVNTAFAVTLAATVTDAEANPVSGVVVTFTPPASGASGSFAGGLNTATTNASGVATSAVFTANGTAGGPYNVVASAAGASSADFVLTNTATPAAKVTTTSGSGQSAAIDAAFAAPLVTTVTDASNNPVSGVVVTFTPPASGASGKFAGGVNTATSNGSGVATSTVFTANAIAGGPYNVVASATGATTANFSLTNQVGTAASITATAGTPQTTPINTAFTTQLQATVKDAGSNPVSGVLVTFTAPASGANGTFAGGVNTATTNASGIATAAVFTANGTAGAYPVTAAVAGVATQAAFSLTNSAGPAASITASAGTPQSATINTAFATPVQATVKDAGSNPVSGVLVTFTAPASGASGTFAGGVVTATATTNAGGVATAPSFTANATAGSCTVTAKTAGVATAADFLLTNNPGPPASIAATAGTPQTAGTNAAFTVPLQATVRDAGNNLVSGAVVTFTAPASGASGTFAGGVNTATTGASGTATAPVFTANGTAGAYTVTAGAAGVSAPANFLLTNNNAQPIVTSLSLTTTLAGGAGFMLTINGSGFTNGATVSFGTNPALIPTSITAIQIVVLIPAGDIATAGVFSVTVTNPAPSGGSSVPQTFTVNNPLPTITILAQTHAAAGAGFKLTVNGTNFVASSVVKFGTHAEATTYVNATQVTAAIPASDVSSAGSVSVTVVNPAPGGGPTPTMIAFTVDGFALAGPTSPATVKAGLTASIPITISPTVNGFANPVTFTIAGLPPHTTFTFNPVSVTPDGTPATTLLTVTTTINGASPPSSTWKRPAPPIFPILLVLWSVVLLACIYTAFRLSRRPRQLPTYAVIIPMGMLLVWGAVLSGCAVQMNGTPKGAAAMTITATSGTYSETTIVTLTVQ